MQCKEALELLSPWLDGELPKELELAVSTHVSSCQRCKTVVDDYKTLGRLIATANDPGPADLADKIRECLKKEGHSHRVGRTTSWKIAFPLAAAAVLTLLGTSTLIFQKWIGARQQISAEQLQENQAIANDLAAMLSAGMNVITRNQSKINNPNLGDKGLSADVVVAGALEIFHRSTGRSASTTDTGSRRDKLMADLLNSMRHVLEQNEEKLNKIGVGYKGFGAAVFARLVNEEFNKRASGTASLKNTAPPNLLRNPGAAPDEWESEAISSKLLSKNWPTGKSHFSIVRAGDRPAFRTLLPQYYKPPCLSCHGEPKGETDITGYRKEGAKLNQLGGALSITLYLQSR